ncbi:ABC transporter permease [Paracoccus sp. (in: a-proteobacteria)]|uniref:ABC transporter permease n=1 Tax=Paracoccus sp. TaxID=267 RepID=UPI00289E5B4D|nr:ABC transporter permease [Paracoccus sp. (in: a-proteobacteria)]
MPPSTLTRFDRIGAVFGVMIFGATFFLPFLLMRASRIAPAEPQLLIHLGQYSGRLWAALFTLVAVLLAFRLPVWVRLMMALGAMLALALALGHEASVLAAGGTDYARISVGAGAWLLFAALTLAIIDALVRQNLGPMARLASLLVALGCLGLALGSGLWRDLSVMREYANHADAFLRECRTHLMLSLGSLAAACAIGLPLAVISARISWLRNSLLPALSMIQTIPSMALFGLLIAPMAWLAAHLPGAGAIGIAGIGPAPAFVALVAYSLLPIVSSTVSGLARLPAPVVDAAAGMGLSPRQSLWQVQIPLAMPAILTGIRITLVQNIGMTVIAGLVGGGGLGVFVFQGISQTASDLVLLGALPAVIMAFTAAVFLDAMIALSRGALPADDRSLVAGAT